ncbi:MAG: gluconate 2-dehydrogenase subunit 3 family protein [Bryobacterales bacterium]|nr:gluconate 2-dehydrogenase subunit 3 family protein [Bryobacterales bacterium]
MSSAQGFVALEALSRRAALRRIAAALTVAGLGRGMAGADAAEIHQQVGEERTLQGHYTVKYFNEHEFRTLERLSELIVPADEGGPSGREGGAPEFIDLLSSQNPELAGIFTGGILWLDNAAGERHGKRFAECSARQQTGLLDLLVDAERNETGEDTRWDTQEYRRFSVFGVKSPSGVRRGLEFFGWARRLIVDAYYTSPAGIKDLGFLGNSARTEYAVPREAIDYAFGRSPFRDA